MAALAEACAQRAVHRAGAHRAADREVPAARQRQTRDRGSHRRHRAVLFLRPVHGWLHEPHFHRVSGQCDRRRRLQCPHRNRGTAMKPPSLTIGIEEEYQIIDPETRELRSYITEILKEDDYILREVKPELHQSIVEIGTIVCETPAQAGNELRRLRALVSGLAKKKGLSIAAAGTHPFSSWIDQEITPLERYIGVKQDMQDLAQQLLIFGTHVHIGIEDKEFLIDAMNVSRYFIPHLLCLTSSSPFWIGRNTGLKSYRSVIFRNFPRTGIPRVMQ